MFSRFVESVSVRLVVLLSDLGPVAQSKKSVNPAQLVPKYLWKNMFNFISKQLRISIEIFELTQGLT